MAFARKDEQTRHLRIVHMGEKLVKKSNKVRALMSYYGPIKWRILSQTSTEESGKNKKI